MVTPRSDHDHERREERTRDRTGDRTRDRTEERTDERTDDRTGERQPEPAPTRYATVADSLTVHGDLAPHEVEALLDHWAKLDVRLRSFGPGAVRLDLYVKDRDTPSQHLTLEATVARWPVLIATSGDADLTHALNVVRDEMIRLITEAKDRHSPRRHR